MSSPFCDRLSLFVHKNVSRLLKYFGPLSLYLVVSDYAAKDITPKSRCFIIARKSRLSNHFTEVQVRPAEYKCVYPGVNSNNAPHIACTVVCRKMLTTRGSSKDLRHCGFLALHAKLPKGSIQASNHHSYKLLLFTFIRR